MTKAKEDRNIKVVYMHDTLKMSFRQISDIESMNGNPLSESWAARIYNREKARMKKEKQAV